MGHEMQLASIIHPSDDSTECYLLTTLGPAHSCRYVAVAYLSLYTDTKEVNVLQHRSQCPLLEKDVGMLRRQLFQCMQTLRWMKVHAAERRSRGHGNNEEG